MVDPVEAEVVRLMFKLFREGDALGGPMGVKAIASWLNTRGYRTRVGARWGVRPLHKILTRETYKGEHRFNRLVWKTREAKPEEDQIAIAVDPIIDAGTFDAVQATLKARNPKVTPPRLVSSPILLTGLATCATCGGGMTLRTGKSGRYRYYTCAAAAQKGSEACRGRSVPMDKLDRIVTDSLVESLFQPERVKNLLTGLINRQVARADDRATRLASLRAKAKDAETWLDRLYAAIENGLADSSDATLKTRLETVRSERDLARMAFERAVSETECGRLSEENIIAFADLMRTNVTSGPIAFRRAYVRSVLDQVEVDDREIRLSGRKSVLEKLVAAGGGQAPPGVPSFVRKWRARRDSNS